MKLTIGISFVPEGKAVYGNYRNAIQKAAAAGGYEVEFVDAWRDPSCVAMLDGILFTGGADIDPLRYGKDSERNLCGDDIDVKRDSAEFAIAKAAEENGLPTLGICRGTQLLNVYHGGTLVTDIASFGGRNHKKIDGEDNHHQVNIAAGSHLRKVVGESAGEINSAHHQAVDTLGEGLVASARAAEDATIEAVEWADPTGKPFFLAVQWHPERMDYESKFAGRLFDTFLWEVAAHKTLKHRMGKKAEAA